MEIFLLLGTSPVKYIRCPYKDLSYFLVFSMICPAPYPRRTIMALLMIFKQIKPSLIEKDCQKCVKLNKSARNATVQKKQHR